MEGEIINLQFVVDQHRTQHNARRIIQWGPQGDCDSQISLTIEALRLLRAIWPETPASLRQKWAKQVSETIAGLHKAGIVWGDVKAENILIDGENNAWITEFGGGYTLGWVDLEKAGTMEGDFTGPCENSGFHL
jgi:tRNA A-37 threonylcarbamoyl transferase component Bud32